MNVLEKILEDIERLEDPYYKDYVDRKHVAEIIRSHIDEREVFKFDFNRVKSFDCQCGRHYVNTYNDGWIPVEERLPEVGKLVSVTIHSSEFISNYHDDWVDDEDKIYYPEEYFTSIGWICSNGRWKYLDECNSEASCSERFGDDKGNIYDVVIAWQPLPEPYKDGRCRDRWII